MKWIFLTLFLLIIQMAYTQNNQDDTVKTVETTLIFKGKLERVGNFHWEMVYKVNEYCISKDDLSKEQADSLKGKKVLVRGKLKIIEGEYGPVKSEDEDGTIYEPLKEPDKLFIINQKFTILE